MLKSVALLIIKVICKAWVEFHCFVKPQEVLGTLITFKIQIKACFTYTFIYLGLVSSKSGFFLTYLRRGVSSHHLLHLYLPSVFSSWASVLVYMTLFPLKAGQKFFFCFWSVDAHFGLHLPGDIFSVWKSFRVVERDLRDVNLREA